jgi:hypothetical protein
MEEPFSSSPKTDSDTKFQIEQNVEGDRNQTIGQVLGGMVVYGTVIYNNSPSEVTHEVLAEVTHEALFDNWQQLKDWLNGSRSSLSLQRRLDEAVVFWQDHGRQDGNLWRSPGLDLLREFKDDMSPEQLKFFNASINAEKYQRNILGGVGVIFLLIISGSFLGINMQAQEANRQKQLAESQAKIAKSQAQKADFQRQLADVELTASSTALFLLCRICNIVFCSYWATLTQSILLLRGNSLISLYFARTMRLRVLRLRPRSNRASGLAAPRRSIGRDRIDRPLGQSSFRHPL